MSFRLFVVGPELINARSLSLLLLLIGGDDMEQVCGTKAGLMGEAALAADTRAP